MFYEFPTINTIDDVLPHIEGRSEFIVADKGDYIVVNYVVATNDTFDMEGPDDLGGAIRRECRGLIFHPTGEIMSRPFHKFFNVGEREETMPANIDMSAPHVIMENMDGSMIRPLLIDGELRLATKMGITEIAEEAEKWLRGKTMICREWILDQVMSGYTPIFEWIGPDNKIVIDYPEHKLVLLAIRHNKTGRYMPIDNMIFELPKLYGTVDGSLDEYVAKHRNDEGREGFIARFADGHMLKGKNDWYVRIHKTKDRIRTERHVVNIILNEELDDLLPLLDEGDLKIVRDVEERFWKAFDQKNNRLYGLYLANREKTKKEFALEVVPTLERKEDARFIFAMLDGKTLRPMMLAHALASVSKTDKYDHMKTWLGME